LGECLTPERELSHDFFDGASMPSPCYRGIADGLTGKVRKATRAFAKVGLEPTFFVGGG
jgi:hypothetical protein